MKQGRVRLLALVAVAALVPAHSAASLPDDPEYVLEKYLAARNRSDAAALAGLYAEDGLILPLDQPIVHGRRKIEDFWKSMLAVDSARRMGAALTAKVLDKNAGPDIGYVVGSLGGRFAEGRNIALCLKRDMHGQWRIAAEIWNASSVRPRLQPAGR